MNLPAALLDLAPLHLIFAQCVKSFGYKVLNYSGNFGLDKENQKQYRDYLSIEPQNLEEKFKLAFFKISNSEELRQKEFLNHYYERQDFLSNSFLFIDQELSDLFSLGQSTLYDSEMLKSYIQENSDLSHILYNVLAEYYVSVLLLYPHRESSQDLRAKVSQHLTQITHQYKLDALRLGTDFLNIAQLHMAIEPSQVSKFYGCLDFVRQNIVIHDKVYECLLNLGSAYMRENALVAKILDKEGIKFQLTPYCLFEYIQCPIQAYPYIIKQLEPSGITQNIRVFLNAQNYRLEKSETFISSAKKLALKESVEYIDLILQKQMLEQLVPSQYKKLEISSGGEKKSVDKI